MVLVLVCALHMGFGWGRVAPGDAPHKYPPRFTLTVGETLVALVPDNASTSRQDHESFGLVVTRTGPGVLRVEPTPTIETALAAAKACDTRLQTNTVFGLAGAYRTSSGFHLLVVTGCESVGAVKNARVFRVTKIETVCVGAKKALGLDASDLCRSNTSSELRPERKSHKLMKTFLASGNVKRLFFSGDANEFDVTRSFSRMNQSTAMEEHESEPISDTNWRRCDGNFLWNRGVGSVFLEGLDKDGQTKADSLLVPLAFGSWGTEQFDVASLGDKSDETKKTIATARCSLVARVSTKRVGIRHHCRGADLGGNVANFVETEQIVEVGVGGLEVEGDTFARDTNKTDTENTENTETETQKRSYVSSFVILRGSVPTRWAQPLLDLRWKFPLLNMDKSDSKATTKHHLAGLRETYGQVAVLDLLKQGKTNKESALAACWRDAIADSGSETSYFPFDLGRQIGFSGDKKALEQMLKVMNKSLTGHGFWFHAKDGATMSDEKVTDQESHKKEKSASAQKKQAKKHGAQTGVIRVNCKDCLDRTNAAQSALGGKALSSQLRELGFEPWRLKPMREKHARLWVAHGDAIAKAYARTNALRRDVTLFGKRTFVGVCSDLKTALTRWAQSKFSDGTAQDGVRFFLSGGKGAFKAVAGGTGGRHHDETNPAPPKITGCFSSCLNQPCLVEEHDAWALRGYTRASAPRKVTTAPAVSEDS